MQLARDGFEGGAADRLARELIELALLGGIRAAAQQLAGIVARFARRLQADDVLGRARLGVVAERKSLFPLAEVVLPESASGQVRSDLKVQPGSIGQPHSGNRLKPQEAWEPHFS